MRTSVQRDPVSLTSSSVGSNANVMKTDNPSGFLPPHNDKFGGSVGTVGSVDYTFAISNANDDDPRSAIRTDIVTFDNPNSFCLQRFGFANSPMQVSVNGYVLTLEENPSKFMNNQFLMPNVPSTGARQDMLILEVWKESVVSGASDDCFFPFGNVGYDSRDVETTYDGCTLLSDNETGGNWPLYLNFGFADPAFDSRNHGKYVLANDANIQDFINNPANNVGTNPDGTYFQVRYRITTLVDVDPEYSAHTSGSIFQEVSGKTFKPQGQLTSREAPDMTYTTGVFIRQSGIVRNQSTQLDKGMFLGGSSTGNDDPMTPISSLSADGWVYAIPICLVHRRNSTAWALDNMNGAGAVGGASGRPDGKFYDQVHQDDILDLRHRINPEGFDYEELYEETLQKVLKSELTTNWEHLKENPDGIPGTYDDLGIWGTKLLRAEGVAGSGFNSSWNVIKQDTCNNGIPANTDGLRNYYSDVPGEQAIMGRIASESGSTVTPSGIFSYSSRVLTTNLSGSLNANNGGSGDNRAVLSGRAFDLRWAGDWKTGGSGGGFGAGSLVGYNYDDFAGDANQITIRQDSFAAINADQDISAIDGTSTYTNGAVTITLHKHSNDTWFAGFKYVGATPIPSTGGTTWTNTFGPGPGTFDATTTYVNAVLKYDGASPSETYYTGEGHDLHAGEEIFFTAYVQYQAGSGFLSRVPYQELQAIKSSGFYINGSSTNALPDNGEKFVPYGASMLGDGKLTTDTHSKSTGLTGFMRYEPVITIGNVSGYDDDLVIQPFVLKEGANDYKMWYRGNATSPAQSFLYAESTDGINWTNHQYITDGTNHGMLGSHANCAAEIKIIKVIKTGSTYEAWFTGWGDGTWGSTRILYTTSANGILWTTPVIAVSPGDGSAHNTTGVTDMTVVKEGASTYKGWYIGHVSGANPFKVIYCESSDGISWTNHQDVYGREIYVSLGYGTYVTQANVYKEGSYYKLQTTSQDADLRYYILESVSTDGKNWSTPIPIIPSHLFGRYTSDPNVVSIIKDDETYKFFVDLDDDTLSPERAIYAGVFTKSHAGNSEIITSGVYTSEGTINYAPAAVDKVLVMYESRAQQQDWSRFSGTTPNMSLDYTLKYWKETGIANSMGTAGTSITYNVLHDYRDSIANIFGNFRAHHASCSEFIINSDNIEVYPGIASTNRFFSDKLRLVLSSTGLLDKLPKPGDTFSFSSLYQESESSGGGKPFAISSASAPHTFLGGLISNETVYGNDFYAKLSFAIAEKNKELFLLVYGEPSLSMGSNNTNTSWTFAINMNGRVLIK